MLGSKQSTKWKPHPRLKQAKDISLVLTLLILALMLFGYYDTEDKSVFWIGIMISTICTYPAVLYYSELARLDKERGELKQSKSS